MVNGHNVDFFSIAKVSSISKVCCRTSNIYQQDLVVLERAVLALLLALLLQLRFFFFSYLFSCSLSNLISYLLPYSSFYFVLSYLVLYSLSDLFS